MIGQNAESDWIHIKGAQENTLQSSLSDGKEMKHGITVKKKQVMS